MNGLRWALRGLVKLFFADWASALAALVWLGIALLAFGWLAPTARGPVLFGGLALILIVSVRAAAKGRD